MLDLVGYVLAMLAVVVAVRLIGERINVPEGIILTLLGLGYGLLPGPNLRLDPDVVLVLVLPPLLYGAARRASLLAIRANWRPIASLSVALVLATALSVGALVHAVAPSIPLAAGLVLGAAVAPPDPVAALAVGRRAGMPPRLTTLIGGEGLLNDATALTTYQVAVGAMVGGGASFGGAAGQFIMAAAGGLAIGAAIGFAIRLLRPLNHDPLIANAVSLATPFLAYLVGEEAHVSGVLAVVITGLMAGHDAPRGTASGASRLQTGAVWQFVEFLLEGLVFLLIGEQLPQIVRGLRGEPNGMILSVTLVTLAAVLLIRPLWIILTHLLPGWLGWRFGDPQPVLSGREMTALSWAGTRGVITLAAIFAVPLTAHGGVPFPGRDLLLLSAYVVVLVTLVGQGATFGPLLRLLGLRANVSEEAQVRNEARIAATEAAGRSIADMHEAGDLPVDIAEAMQRSLRERAERYRARITMLQASEDSMAWTPEYEAAVRARHAAIDAQREELLRWRDSGRLSDDNLRKLTHELDHEERTLPGR